MNITLVGFMGTGKSSVGRRLAKRMGVGWTFVDVDAEIERSAHMPISQIFTERGEPVFRRLERRWVKRMARATHQVISTGGGVFVDEELRGLLRASGAVICLTARPQVILDRVKHKLQMRPLLRSDDPLARIRTLLKEREAAYAKADLTIDTSDVTIDEVVERIWALLNPLLCKGWQYLQQHGDELAGKYGGQYVVVREGRVIACGKTHLEAYQKAGTTEGETGIYYIPPASRSTASA